MSSKCNFEITGITDAINSGIIADTVTITATTAVIDTTVGTTAVIIATTLAQL